MDYLNRHVDQFADAAAVEKGPLKTYVIWIKNIYVVIMCKKIIIINSISHHKTMLLLVSIAAFQAVDPGLIPIH